MYFPLFHIKSIRCVLRVRHYRIKSKSRCLINILWFCARMQYVTDRNSARVHVRIVVSHVIDRLSVVCFHSSSTEISANDCV